MSLLGVIAAVWLLGPMIAIGVIVAACEWAERRRNHLVLALDRLWALPAAERAAGRLAELEPGLLVVMDDDPTPHGRRH